ncbi:MAG TPA: SpoVR family protein [Chloroflexota bacterium]|nr:SpoVR family protein [Chloroflexota bacterium]
MTVDPVTKDPFTAQLEHWIERIWEQARAFGLDPYPTHFEIVPATIMYEFGAYGLPGRFSHWTHGRAFHQMKTMYDYGLSKIYELVINTDPCYAFLMEANSPLENKLVVAHVLAHCDFFRHNAYFRHTNRQMVETASVNAERIRSYEFEHGVRAVERFLDAVLSIEEHVDVLDAGRPGARAVDGDAEDKPSRPRTTAYDDLFELDTRLDPGKGAPAVRAPRKRFPVEPQRDILGFLQEHTPHLEDWQRDVIAIVRQERLYFVPQMRTKMLNEGWASLWHSRILRELDLPDDEYAEFARLHSSVAAPSRRSLNPYYVGMKLLEHVEREEKVPLFEIRKLESDVSFMRNFLNKEAVEELDLYLYEFEGGEWKVVEKDWEKVRDGIVRSLTTYGIPYIVVEDGDHKRNRELYLKHCFEGDELDLRYAEKTLAQVHAIWDRTVHLETVIEGKPTVLTFDGEKSSRATL